MFGKNDDEGEEPEQQPEQAEPAVEEPEPDGPSIEDLRVRLSELEEELDSTESSIRSIRSSQEEMAETVEEVNDTVRRLLGVYDQLTAADNPFVDGDTESAAEQRGETDQPAREGAPRAETEDPHQEDEVVAFEDLEEAADEPDSGSEQRDDGFLWEADEKPTPAEASESAQAGREAKLADLPAGYAGDALVMEWLAMLVEEAGPAGTLRAIDHYEDVGWVGPCVRERLVDVLGGPDLDVHVDPNRPAEPAAGEHTESYRYIETLDRLADI